MIKKELFATTKSFVVIGHGESAVDKGWGPQINKIPCVIRMWNGNKLRKADYGSKYDIGFYQISPKFNDIMRKKAKFIRKPKIGFVGSYLKGPTIKFGNTIEVLDQSDWCGRAFRMGARSENGPILLTRGTVAALWVITNAQPGSKLRLVGFDNVLRQFATGGRYGTEEVTAWRYHDFSKERLLLEIMAKGNGVELIFIKGLW